MSGDYSAGRPTTPLISWDSARGVWVTSQSELSCEHSAPFLGIWPTSGSMRSGSVYRRPGWAPPTPDTASSSMRGLLPTPRTSDTDGGGENGDGGPDLRTVASRLLP